MHVFATAFNASGHLIGTSGLSFLRRRLGKRVVGKHISEMSPDPELMQRRFDRAMSGKIVRFVNEDENGQWWSVQMFRVPEETAVVTFASTLAAAPPRNLSDREEQILTWICEDVPTTEQRERLGISTSAFTSAMKDLRKKIGVRSNFGLVRWAILNGYASE